MNADGYMRKTGSSLISYLCSSVIHFTSFDYPPTHVEQDRDGSPVAEGDFGAAFAELCPWQQGLQGFDAFEIERVIGEMVPGDGEGDVFAVELEHRHLVGQGLLRFGEILAHKGEEGGQPLLLFAFEAVDVFFDGLHNDHSWDKFL